MGKYKAWLMEQDEYNDNGHDFDEGLYHYEQQCWEEQNTPYQLTDEESIAYEIYMRGGLKCGELINTVLTQKDTNSKSGQLNVIPRRVLRSSRK